ncbi:pyruvate oxidase [Lactiplantibacillus paraplantarum]|uniref:Pyruvate oxidase n=1 Tax=Lactiplantibacillus paraplantarum TaxID=60520 RepID=A0AAD0TNL0_9LACO|nr:pyruvate oxidase [Lactiplantibacillus paraplantarum]AVW09709.1 pyruvate oxidase [Lactiplantibacillus paraplantarum]AYJ37922.1 pyruvate oxidase [Lactiplantibacillus paraplantarum]ERL45594.1 pyruvate oxidase [Lactiplantibacillus paraplantarum]KRL49426.1 pyruvate oxidase [Lactiplantibacillus paraplantarum DSM 10667]MCU4682878.1 pyruvate oxidase [Lactiplantibacillus paraplantarum]
MAKISGSDAVLKVIQKWGVKHIYGLPGGSFDSTMNAIYNQRETLKYIQVRHEEAGAIAASADYKLTGKIGVCFGSAGPGAVHLLNGLYDAKEDGIPMLAIVAQVPTKRMNMDFFQAMNEEPIFDDVAVWNRTAMTAESLPMLTDEAIRQAYAHNGVAVLTIPKDFGWAEIEDNFETNAGVHTVNYPAPTAESVADAIELIKAAKSPMIYFGVGAKDAAEELKAASEKFKMPLVSSVLAKGIIEDDYPAYLGSTGRVAPKPGAEIGFSTDLILWVGNNVPFSIFLFNKKAKVIQIDIDSEKFGKRHHTNVAIQADAKKALTAINAAGEARADSAFYDAAVADKKNWDKWQASFNDSTESPVRPEPIFDVLNQEASDKAVWAIDVGNVNINFERLIRMHGDQKWATSGIYATMGFGVPAALAAKVNYPDRDVYSLSGDGAFAMLSEEILAQVKYNLHVINIVFSNETLGFIEAEQTDDTHQPLSGVDLPDTDWAKVGEGYGAVGYTVRTKAEFKQALEDAKQTDKPVVIDVKLTHAMPFTTEHMYLDDAWQDKDKIAAFVKKYDAQDLKPFSYFLKQAQAN